MSYNHDHENEVTYFAKTNFRNAMTKFGIKTDDRRRHVYVVGKTGMGKSVLLENLVLSDIYAGHGCCYVDPHGDTAEKLINFIPSWRINDVVYFNPADAGFPVGFNILEAVSERHKHLVASGMMGVFKKIWEDQWSSRMEYILNNTILALLDNPGSTLLGINRMLSDPDYRKRMIGNVTDPVVRQFWLKEFASYNEKYAQEAVAPIQNKIGQFLSASVIRNIVAQAKSTINIREIMDTQKIFIVNLSKGRIGEDSSRLLGGLLITKLQLSAMERVDMLEKDRLDFYLYVDEFQNFAVDSFAGILSEARKYRLCLTMAHQYIAQLTDEVREAVFGNVGTIISFRVGSPDAKYMETEFAPRFLPEDLINLPKYNIYLKLLIGGVTSQPFSAQTLAPIAQITNSEERVIKVSRERYSKERSLIEEQIMTWSGMENTDIDTMLAAAEVKKKDDKIAAKESKKPKFEYDCSRCNKKMVLPVELDRSRPIYCEDCIEIAREEKKGKGVVKPTVAITRPSVPAKPIVKETPHVVASVSVKTSVVDAQSHLPDEPSISLSSLMGKGEVETLPAGRQESGSQVEKSRSQDLAYLQAGVEKGEAVSPILRTAVSASESVSRPIATAVPSTKPVNTAPTSRPPVSVSPSSSPSFRRRESEGGVVPVASTTALRPVTSSATRTSNDHPLTPASTSSPSSLGEPSSKEDGGSMLHPASNQSKPVASTPSSVPNPTTTPTIPPPLYPSTPLPPTPSPDSDEQKRKRKRKRKPATGDLRTTPRVVQPMNQSRVASTNSSANGYPQGAPLHADARPPVSVSPSPTPSFRRRELEGGVAPVVPTSAPRPVISIATRPQSDHPLTPSSKEDGGSTSNVGIQKPAPTIPPPLHPSTHPSPTPPATKPINGTLHVGQSIKFE